MVAVRASFIALLDMALQEEPVRDGDDVSDDATAPLPPATREQQAMETDLMEAVGGAETSGDGLECADGGDDAEEDGEEDGEENCDEDEEDDGGVSGGEEKEEIGDGGENGDADGGDGEVRLLGRRRRRRGGWQLR